MSAPSSLHADSADLLNIQDLMNETGCTWETAYQVYFEAEGDMVLARELLRSAS